MRGKPLSTLRAYKLRAQCISGPTITGATMTTISIVSERSAQADDQSLKTIAMFACFGLVVSFGMMIIGVDLSAGWL
jgi:hypothetical protein